MHMPPYTYEPVGRILWNTMDGDHSVHASFWVWNNIGYNRCQVLKTHLVLNHSKIYKCKLIMLCNIPEEQRSPLHWSRSLKSCIIFQL
jgi:hypothetical protein